jgi:hypothetical protein
MHEKNKNKDWSHCRAKCLCIIQTDGSFQYIFNNFNARTRRTVMALKVYNNQTAMLLLIEELAVHHSFDFLTTITTASSLLTQFD